VLATTPTVLRMRVRGISPRLAVVGVYTVLVVVGVLLLEVVSGSVIVSFTEAVADQLGGAA
jgi:predicted PurR-regulated permease PerM